MERHKSMEQQNLEDHREAETSDRISELADLTNRQFRDYLYMVAADYRASGREATAEDYEEAARRLGPERTQPGDEPRQEADYNR